MPKRPAYLSPQARHLLWRLWGVASLRTSGWRLALLLAPWLIALALPGTRRVLLVNQAVDVPAWWHAMFGDASITDQQRAMARYPHSRALQFFRIVSASYPLACGEASLGPSLAFQQVRGALNDLVAGSPNTPWVLAYRLNTFETGSLDWRLGLPAQTPLPTPPPPAPPPLAPTPGFAPPPRPPGFPVAQPFVPFAARPEDVITGKPPSSESTILRSFDQGSPAANLRAWRAAMAQALALARRGESLVPANSFFNWQAARYLFAVGNDAAALAQLHQGAAKARCDNYGRELLQELVQAEELIAPLQPDLANQEELVQYDLASNDYRHTTELAVAAAARLEAHGDNTGALRIYGDLINLCVLMRDGSYRRQDALASCACFAMVLGALRRRVSWRSLRGPNLSSTWLHEYVYEFAKYATQHGASKLAQQARSEGPVFEALSDKLALIAAKPRWRAVPERTDTVLLIILLLATGLILQWLALLAWRCLCWFLLMPMGLHKYVVDESDVAANVLASVAVGLGLAVPGVVLLRVYDAVANAYKNAGNSSAGTFGMAAPAPYLPWLYPATEAVTLAFVAPALATALWCACVTGWRELRVRQLHGTAPGPLGAASKEMTQTPAPTITAAALANVIVSYTPIACAVLLLLMALAFGPGGGWNAFPIAGVGSPMARAAVVAVIFFVTFGWQPFAALALLGWMLKWRWWPAPQWRASAHYGLEWYRRSLSWCSTVIGWLFLLAALCATLAYHQGHAQFDAALARGEVSVLSVPHDWY